MSKKDYVRIAAAIREELAVFDGAAPTPFVLTQRATLIAVSRRIADALAEDNSAFNRDRFLTAAGVPA